MLIHVQDRIERLQVQGLYIPPLYRQQRDYPFVLASVKFHLSYDDTSSSINMNRPYPHPLKR